MQQKINREKTYIHLHFGNNNHDGKIKSQERWQNTKTNIKINNNE